MPHEVPKKPLIMIAARERGKDQIIFLLSLCIFELHRNFIFIALMFSSEKKSEHLSLIFRITGIRFFYLFKVKIWNNLDLIFALRVFTDQTVNFFFVDQNSENLLGMAIDTIYNRNSLRPIDRLLVSKYIISS